MDVAKSRATVVVACVAIGLICTSGPQSAASTAHIATHAARSTVTHAGATAREFRVAPAPYLIVGGIYVPRRTCKPTEVGASSMTRRSPDGVIVVVKLTTERNCDIQVGDLNPTLYDAQHDALAVPVTANADTVNPAGNQGWTPFTSLGFAWDGSWCGAAATTVAVPLTNGTVEAPLTGPQPACAGSSSAVVIPGAFGYGDDPVQGAPPEWRFLTAAFQVPAVTRSPKLVHPHVTFTNTSDSPIVLRPTPTYEIGVHDKYGDGTEGEGENVLRLSASDRTVPALGSLRVDLHTQSIVEDYRNLRGKRLTTTFEMAGLPTASTTSTLDHPALKGYEGHCDLHGSTLPTFTTHNNKECVSLKWAFATAPKPTSRVLHVRWHGDCLSKPATANKRETRRSVVVAVTAIETMNPPKGGCATTRGHVEVRLTSHLGSRSVGHAATQP